MADNALRGLVSTWIAKLRLSWEAKKREFQDDADEAMRFFNGPYQTFHSWRGEAARTWSSMMGANEEVEAPAFQMSVNKVAELVQLFGPALYHKNPDRKVNPRKPPMLPLEAFGSAADPAVQFQYHQLLGQQSQQGTQDAARAALIQAYLNYTPTALDLKTESRWAIDEAIIMGRGVLFCDTYKPAGSSITMVGNFYRSVCDVLIDSDAERPDQICWMALRCVHPYWKVERQYNLPPDSLKNKATMESGSTQATMSILPDGDYLRKQGKTNDLMVYWKIWSKMGMGGRLSGMAENLRAPLEVLGDFCYIVVAENVPYPLNVPPPVADSLIGDDPLIQQTAVQVAQPMVQWPTPFWADDTWPLTFIDFHPVPRRIWPMSHIGPAMGELKFLNWAFSFLAGKVRTACRDFIAIAKSASEEMKDRIKSGKDYTILEVEALHGSIDQVVKFLQHPEFNGEIYKVIQGVMENFERRTGLTELMYGQSQQQDRSATESQGKMQMANVRPDDMANKVEDAMSDCARKEAFAARWHVGPQDVVAVLGQQGAQWWGQLVTGSDPADILHSLEYRIEAGSTKKPNKTLEASNMQAAVQSLFQPFWQYASSTGNVAPVNNLIEAWSRSMNMDPAAFLLPAPPPPQAQPLKGSPAQPKPSPQPQQPMGA